MTVPTPRDDFDRIAALVHPLDLDAVVVRTDDPEGTDYARADYAERVLAARATFAEQLRAAAEEDVDPLLAAVEGLAATRDAADAKIRSLIAYAREFLPKRRYTLDQLARAAGMSSSGVDTAYGRPRTTQNPIIRSVAEATGITPHAERGHVSPRKSTALERAVRLALTATDQEIFHVDAHPYDERGAGKSNVPQGAADPRYRTVTVANRPFNAEFTTPAGEPGQGALRRIVPGTNGEETVPLDPADLPKIPGYVARPADTDDDQTS